MGLLTLFALTLLGFLLVVLFMAVGVLMGRRQISGSCWGLGQNEEGQGGDSCSLCSNPAAACRDLKRRMGRENQENLESEQSSPEAQATTRP